MGNDSSSPTGTDFKTTQASRKYDNAADDLPALPYLKQKAIVEDVTATLKSSIYMANFKRAFRGFLRKRPERAQMGVFMRIKAQSTRDADLLGLPKDTLDSLLDLLVIRHAPKITSEIIEELKERNKIKSSDPPVKQVEKAESVIGTIFSQVVSGIVEATAKKIYDKYSRGDDPEESDVEVDAGAKAKAEKERLERAKAESAKRQKEAEEWARQAEEEARKQEEKERDQKMRQEELKAVRDSNVAASDI